MTSVVALVVAFGVAAACATAAAWNQDGKGWAYAVGSPIVLGGVLSYLIDDRRLARWAWALGFVAVGIALTITLVHGVPDPPRGP